MTLSWTCSEPLPYSRGCCTSWGAPPRYFWTEEYLEGQPWFEVQLTISARTHAPLWQEQRAEFEGRTPWEGAQVVAFEVLSKICEQHGNELIGSAAGTFPQQFGHSATAMR